MLRDKVLFFSERCDYDDNKISATKDLSFLFTLFVIITRSLKSIIENDSNENSFDINHSKDVSNKKRLTSTLRALKEKKIQKSNLIDIVEINAFAYYHLIRNKENKLFFLTMNEIYDTLV